MIDPAALALLCQFLHHDLAQRGRATVPGIGTFTARARPGSTARQRAFRVDPRLKEAVDRRDWTGGVLLAGFTVPGLDPAQLAALLDELVRQLVEPPGTITLAGVGTLRVHRTPHRRVEVEGGIVCIPGQNQVRFTPPTAA